MICCVISTSSARRLTSSTREKPPTLRNTNLRLIAFAPPVNGWPGFIALRQDAHMIEDNRRLHLVWPDKRGGPAQLAYCLVNVRENSPVRMRTARPSAKRAATSSP